MREDIKDTEIRIIGGSPKVNNDGQKSSKLLNREIQVLLVILLISIIVLAVWYSSRATEAVAEELVEEVVFEPEPQPVIENSSKSVLTWIESFDEVSDQTTMIKDTVVNDIELTILLPLNATPALEVGYSCLDKVDEYVMFFQAADIRADNKKIVGAFVLNGQPLSWGLSKKGFCGIIDGKITVGTADNSELFELATEKSGYFFRQYPLVDKGRLVESELKAKTTRRSLSEIGGRIVVIESKTKESMHDFSQALIDLGVNNAIYLVGSNSIGLSADANGEETRYGIWSKRKYKNISFIVWKK